MSIDKLGFKNAAKSLSLYHRITSSKLALDEAKHDENVLEKLYVDLLPDNGILNEVLEEHSLFLVGRKGTGKSTIISRAQLEIKKQKKSLSVYINAKSIYKKSEINNVGDLEGLKNLFTSDELMKLQLIRNFILEFSKSLLEELKKEENGYYEKFKNLFRSVKINTIMSELELLIDEPELVNINKLQISDNKTIDSKESVAEIKAELKSLTLEGNASYTTGQTNEKAYQNVIARIFNVGEIVEKINDLIEVCKRNSLYIFIDDYSELNRNDRSIFMESIISPFYHLGIEKIHLKIACYPNKIDPIKLDSGKYKIRSIDMYNIYGRDNTISNTEKKAIDFTKRLIENRIHTYCQSDIEDYFDLSTNSLDDYYRLLYQASINIPRVLGHILNECYLKNVVYEKPITRHSIIEAAKQYYYDHVSTYFDKFKATINASGDDNLDIFVQENLKNALVNFAQKQKYDLKHTTNSYFQNIDSIPTSHFTILPQHEQYLESLEFNGFVHKINVIAGKGREKESFKNQNRLLYSFDRGLCAEEKIDYGKPEHKDTKYFQQRGFEYDDIILMTLKDNKKIVCKSCGTSYIIDELSSFRDFNMKCKQCRDGICEVEFDRELKELAERKLTEAILTESELDVMYAILLLNKNLPEEVVTANLIGKETDYNSYFIAWRCKKLEESGYVNRSKINDYDSYRYSLSERATELLKKIINR